MYALFTDEIEHDGMAFKVTAYHDECMSAPWVEHDGHGPVSEWTTRSKLPGEMVLNHDRSSKRYYDFREAVKTAKVDGWNTAPFDWPTDGARAHAAAMADFKHLKGWCNDEWCWIWIKVQLLDDSDDIIPECEATLGGIESENDYWKECAEELAAEIIAQIEQAA